MALGQWPAQSSKSPESASVSLPHQGALGKPGAGMGFILQVEDLVRKVLKEAKAAGLSREEVVQRLKNGETLNQIFPGLGDPFPGRTTAYLVWELQAMDNRSEP